MKSKRHPSGSHSANGSHLVMQLVVQACHASVGCTCCQTEPLPRNDQLTSKNCAWCKAPLGSTCEQAAPSGSSLQGLLCGGIGSKQVQPCLIRAKKGYSRLVVERPACASGRKVPSIGLGSPLACTRPTCCAQLAPDEVHDCLAARRVGKRRNGEVQGAVGHARNALIQGCQGDCRQRRELHLAGCVRSCQQVKRNSSSRHLPAVQLISAASHSASIRSTCTDAITVAM